MELKLNTRTELGKSVKKMRDEGFVPAELYGHGVANIHVSVAARDFAKAYAEAGEHDIVTAVLDDGSKVPVIISAIHEDPISGNFLAADFRQVRMDEKIQANVPVMLIGEAPAIKAGFVVLHVIHELEIEVLPGDLPSHLEVSIAGLEKPGDHVTVGDIKVPEKVKIRAEAEATIANVQEKRVEEAAPVAAPAAEAAAPAAAEPTPAK